MNPLKYTPIHQKQYEARASDRAIRALFWGNRVGKTEWGAQEVTEYLYPTPSNTVDVLQLDGHIIRYPRPRRQINRPIEIWSACPSYDQQKETTQKKLEKYLPKHLIKPNGITFVKKGVWGEVVLIDGSRINFKSYEQGREKFQGAGKRIVWFDEEPPKDIWEECFVRVEAGIPLDIILTMTPVNGMTWVYDEIYLASDNQDLFVSEAEWDDNPFLDAKQKAQMVRGLSPEALKVRREGKFVKKIGMVLPWFQRKEHIVDLPYDPSWIASGAIDFGFSNPACFGLIGVDYDDNINLFDGFYERLLTTPKIGYKILDTIDRYGIKTLDIIGDSAQASDIQELNDFFASDEIVKKGYNLTIRGITKVSGTNTESWDEFRANRMQQYGELTNGKTKFRASKSLMTFDEKAGVDINWFMKEAENLKWRETPSPMGDKQASGMWDPRYPNHAIDMLSYFVVDHIDSPDRPKEFDVTANKLPGTFVPLSPVEDEDENAWGGQAQGWGTEDGIL